MNFGRYDILKYILYLNINFKFYKATLKSFKEKMS